jgi:hypothetical protein
MTPATAASHSRTASVRPAIPDVVDEHVEEHGFLSIQRRKLQFSLELPVRRLAEIDERLDAHWDGLAVNRPASEARVTDGLAADDPWERATCARAWMTFVRPGEDALLERWDATPPEHAASWREALRGLAPRDVERLAPLASHPRLAGVGRALVADALGWHGRLDVVVAARFARDADPLVRLAVARHAHVGAAAGAPAPPSLHDDADERVCRRALWSEALADRESALERARRLTDAGTPEPFAVRVVGLFGTPDDHAILARAVATEPGRRAAFHAFADLGTAAAIESLVRLLALPDPVLTMEVTEALETAIGPIPREDPGVPATPAEAAARIETIAPLLAREDARVLAGPRRPWRGEPSDAPGAWAWRAAIANRGRDDGLRRDVPDGFFGGLPVSDARPGE